HRKSAGAGAVHERRPVPARAQLASLGAARPARVAVGGPMREILTSLDAILAPARAALLVVDVQHDFIHPEGWAARHGSSSLRQVIPPINRLIAAARAAGVTVVYVLMEHGPAIDLPNYRARYVARGMEGDILCAAGTWGARLDGEVTVPT